MWLNEREQMWIPSIKSPFLFLSGKLNLDLLSLFKQTTDAGEPPDKTTKIC